MQEQRQSHLEVLGAAREGPSGTAGSSTGKGRAQSSAGGRNQAPSTLLAPRAPRGEYLLAAAPAGCLVGRELLLHMSGFVHLLGVKGQAAQWAQGGWYLQAWLEALPAKPAEVEDMSLRSGQNAPAQAGQLTTVVNYAFLETVFMSPSPAGWDG